MSAALRRMTAIVPLDWLVLLALVLMWGSSFAAMKGALSVLDPAWITVGRLWVAVAVLAVAMPLAGERLPPVRAGAGWGPFIIVGITGTALPFFLFAWATARIDTAIVAICNGASPIITAVLAHVLVAHERLTGARLAGVLLGFGGLVALTAPAIDLSGAGTAHSTAGLLGMLAGIGGAAGYAIANIVTKRAPRVGPIAASLIYCFTGALLATAAALALDAPWRPGNGFAWANVVALGLFPTALAGIGYVWIIQRRGPVFASLGTYLSPIWATVLGITLLGEHPAWNAYLALALILGGVALAGRARTAR